MNLSIIIGARMLNEQGFMELCILKIYEMQTSQEQDVYQSIHKNNVGFSKADAAIMSEYGERIRMGRGLLNDEYEACKKVMYKYRKQLSNLLTEIEATT